MLNGRSDVEDHICCLALHVCVANFGNPQHTESDKRPAQIENRI